MAKLVESYPDANFLYHADTAHAPFGGKSREVLLAVLKDCIALFCGKVDFLVVACNTTSTLLKFLKPTIPVFGIAPPVFGCEPAKTLLLATPFTVDYLRNNGLPAELDAIGCGWLVSLAETFALNPEKAEQALKEKLNLRKRYENVILGCTHYPLLQKPIAAVLGNPTFLTGAEQLLENVKNFMPSKIALANPEKARSPRVEFSFSGGGNEGYYRAVLAKLLNDKLAF